MKLVLDTNIVISALISPNGVISNLIFKNYRRVKFFAPLFILQEIYEKQNKILKITGYTDQEFIDLLMIISKRISFIDTKLLDLKVREIAFETVKDIDPKDYEFVAVSIQTGFLLWTGDKKLKRGLKNKGFDQVIDTQELARKLKL